MTEGRCAHLSLGHGVLVLLGLVVFELETSTLPLLRVGLHFDGLLKELVGLLILHASHGLYLLVVFPGDLVVVWVF